MFERYIALVHIGVGGMANLRNAVDYILEHDSISDVRACAEAAMKELNVHNLIKPTNDNSSKSVGSITSNVTALPTSDLNDLLKHEREFLARDCIETNNTKEDVQKWLKDHGF